MAKKRMIFRRTESTLDNRLLDFGELMNKESIEFSLSLINKIEI